jgi:intron-binding protein aquarius
MTVDSSRPTKIRTQLIFFFISASQSLENGIVRKQCAPLVGISLWHNLHSGAAREERFDKNTGLKKA